MSLISKRPVLEKLLKFQRETNKNDGRIGTCVRSLHLNVNNACNFKCKHCFTKAPAGLHGGVRMDWPALERLVRQADELGFFEIDIGGGEPFFNLDNLYRLVGLCMPDRFYIDIVTNGSLVNADNVRVLAELGMDMIAVSVSGMDAKAHDDFAGKPGAHQKALEALDIIKAAGMDAAIAFTAGHYNVQNGVFEAICDYAEEHDYSVMLNLASPAGNWRGRRDIVITEEDSERINEARQRYRHIIHDRWNPFDKNKKKMLGCNAVNRIYVTPQGDILACPFLHIKIGNIYESNLADIIAHGFSFKQFRRHSNTCLASADVGFIEKYLHSDTGIFNPPSASELFEMETEVLQKNP